MIAEHCVIIGNGPAANAAASTLRQRAPETTITIIGKERFHHYKPHLLPDYIAGKVSEKELYVPTPMVRQEGEPKLRLGQSVVGVDFLKREVVLEHKEIVPFDRLIIATGGRPRIPEPYQVFEDLMLTLKTPADAKRWTERLDRADSVLIVGGDLTSFRVVEALLTLKKQVSFILNEESFWPVPFGEDIRSQASSRLKEKGVEVLECRKIRRIARISEDELEVETDSETLTAGVLGAFFGLVPDVKFLAGSGLDIERGILVDEYLKTRFDRVYAAGDCAQVFHPGMKDYWVSIGYHNARTLGRIAASNLLGGMFSLNVAPESIFQMDGVAANTSWWMEF